ncbi:MAG: class I SAM-dependent methyltransferase, partial [Candidatus Thorarchaeota archaeon]
MDDFIKANKELWEERTLAHEKSEFYNVEGFLRGNQTLDPIELEEIGDVKGKSLLHLMCHFGLDTLSWARLGANVTGVDIAKNAIELANKLSKQIGMDTRFIQSNVYELPAKLDEQFDIVFMSGGVINWLPDMEGLLQIAARYVKPGGFYYLRDFHPFFWVFDDEIEEPILKVRYPYFQGKEPLHFESDMSYASK